MKVRLPLIILVFLGIMISSNQVFAQDYVEYPVYVIQSGDSLAGIAQLFNTSVEEIVQVNNLSNPDLISPGQILKIPGFPGITGTLKIVVTGLGENFSLLPIKYQSDINQIIQINKLLSPSQIFVGSQLIIPVKDEDKSLVPVVNLQSSETLLETSVALNLNPESLNLINNITNPSLLLPNTIIFTFPSDTIQNIDLFAPDLTSVTLSPLPLVQGATEVVSIKTNQVVKLSGYLNNFPLVFFSEKLGEYFSLQGIYAMADPGLTDFTITEELEDGSQRTYTQQVLLKPGQFDTDPPLIVDPKTIDPAVTGPENDLVHSLISVVTPQRYWSTIFSSPAFYQEYNSLFGTRRTYNSDSTVTFHTGVDFAGGITLPILAPAPGKVVFAGPLTVRGNAVFIDHGWGVFSGFFHQDSILVKVGDFVSVGQQIGTVGNTGRVDAAGDYYGAGAHLHWELWVNGVQVNPLDWLSTQYP